MFSNLFYFKKMDEVIKVLHGDHDIIMITGTSRNYIDSFLKRFGIFECFKEIYARPSTITEQGSYVIIHTISIKYVPWEPEKLQADGFLIVVPPTILRFWAE